MGRVRRGEDVGVSVVQVPGVRFESRSKAGLKGGRGGRDGRGKEKKGIEKEQNKAINSVSQIVCY